MNELEQKARQGEKARQLLKDPLLAQTLKDMKAFWFNEIQKTSARETRKREECYRMLKATEQFEKILTQRIKLGKAAMSAMDKAKQQLKRIIRTEY